MDKKKEYNKKYYQENKKKLAEQRKQYRQEHKEQSQQYRQENKKKIAEQQKQYYQENRKQIIDKNKEYSKCRSCKLFLTHARSKYLCSYCNPVSSNREKTKENKLKTFLELYYTVTHNKKVNLDQSCQTYFPDFLIDCNNFFIVVEIDEFAHKSYDKNCELIRMNNISFCLGLPTVFIRFNPDFKLKTENQYKILKSYIDYYLSKPFVNNTIEYLFY